MEIRRLLVRTNIGVPAKQPSQQQAQREEESYHRVRRDQPSPRHERSHIRNRSPSTSRRQVDSGDIADPNIAQDGMDFKVETAKLFARNTHLMWPSAQRGGQRPGCLSLSVGRCVTPLVTHPLSAVYLHPPLKLRLADPEQFGGQGLVAMGLLKCFADHRGFHAQRSVLRFVSHRGSSWAEASNSDTTPASTTPAAEAACYTASRPLASPRR